jgi:demethylmenaquinone methyltransferase / 2-methoxy-6-polyprenyl-1,4-benzoquinol methylase
LDDGHPAACGMIRRSFVVAAPAGEPPYHAATVSRACPADRVVAMRQSDKHSKGWRAWDAEALRAPHAQPDKAARVQSMFDAIAPTYERVNTVATLGRDAAWRRAAVAAASVQSGDLALDVCCGTGDMVRVFARVRPVPKLIIGVDFAAGMLERGHCPESGPTVQWIRGDALRLPLADASVDVISCVFGVRNFRDLQVGLDEMARVARPGARVVILEFAAPESPLLRWAYNVYCDAVLPWLGALISRDRTGAYRYLPRSIRTFESARTMLRRLEAAGFAQVELRRMNFGGVVLYRGVKPGAG